MPGAATSYLENKTYDVFFRLVAPTLPGSVYLALFTADPGETGSQVSEVSGGSYARQPVVFGSTSAAVGSGTAGTNTAQVTFPSATAPWGTVTHAAVCDAAVGGNVLWRVPLNAPRAVNIGDDIRFLANSLAITVD